MNVYIAVGHSVDSGDTILSVESCLECAQQECQDRGKFAGLYVIEEWTVGEGLAKTWVLTDDGEWYKE